MIQKNRVDYSIPVLFIFALGIRLLGLDKGIWYDELESLRIAFLNQDFLSTLRGYIHPPLYFVLLRAWSMVSTHEVFLRLLSVLLSMLTLATIVAWTRQYSKPAALLAGLLYSTLPLFLRYAHEIRNYSLLLLATALAFYTASRIIYQKRSVADYTGLGLSLILLVQSHASSIFLMACVGLYLLLELKSKVRTCLKPLGMAFGAAAIVFVLTYYVFLERTHQYMDTWWVTGILKSGYLKNVALRLFFFDQMAVLLQNSIYDDRAPFHILSKIFLIAAVSGFFVMTLLGNYKKYYPLLAASFLYVLLMIGYSLFALPIILPRTMMATLIPFIVFISLQIVSIKLSFVRKLLTGALIVACSLSAFYWARYQAYRPFEPLKSIGKALNEDLKDSDLVLVFPPYIDRAIRYYADKKHFNKIIRLDEKRATRFIHLTAKKPDNPDEKRRIFFIVRPRKNYPQKPGLDKIMAKFEQMYDKPRLRIRAKNYIIYKFESENTSADWEKLK